MSYESDRRSRINTMAEEIRKVWPPNWPMVDWLKPTYADQPEYLATQLVDQGLMLTTNGMAPKKRLHG